MHETLQREETPYILGVEESPFVRNGIKRVAIVEKAHRSSENQVLKQLHGHCYPFLRKHEGKDHHMLPFLTSLA